MTIYQEIAKKLLAAYNRGEITSMEFRKGAGRKFAIRECGKRLYSKYDGAKLREIRARNGVGRPPAVIRARIEAGKQP